MSSILQKNELQQSQKLDLQNSQNMMINNNDSNRYSTINNRSVPGCRKTSKRRQAQEEKSVVLQLFKELLKVVNQKFQNAYLSPPKPKLPKPPKMLKNQSVRASKKQENLKIKKEETNSVNCPIINRIEDKSQSREINPSILPFNQPNPQANNQPANINSHSSPLVFPTFNSNSHISSHVRKGSQSHGHRQKSLNEKHQLLKETLKKQIFENYSVEMKYIIHQDFVQEAQEAKLVDQNGKMIDQSEENRNKVHRTEGNQINSQHYDDFELMSHEQKMQEEFIKSMKNIDNKNMDLEENDINGELEKQIEKFQQEVPEQSSSSSCEENQKYPPHSHMPEGHASTTQQFLQQHHPIVTTLPQSCQSLTILEHHESQGEQKNNPVSVQKLPSHHLNEEKNT